MFLDNPAIGLETESVSLFDIMFHVLCKIIKYHTQ